MKKTLLLPLIIILLGAALVLSVAAAETLVAKGNNGESITWQLFDRYGGAGEEPHYKLVFAGEGTLVGYTNDGKQLSYGNYSTSHQFQEWKNNIYEIVVGDGITAIGAAGVAFFPQVRTIEIPAEVTSLANQSFAGNKMLERVSVRGKNTFLGADLSMITSFGTHIFDGCSSLKYIHFNPEYVGNIRNEVIKSCTALKVLVIPEGVTEITADAFEYTQLENVIFLGDPTIGKDVFKGAETKNLTLYGSVNGGNVETFAKGNGIKYVNDIPDIDPLYYSSDPNVIDIGKAGTDVYYKLVCGEDGFATMYVFGSGRKAIMQSVADDSLGFYTRILAWWYPYNNLIKKIVFPQSISEISGHMGGNMPNLKEVEITSSLKALGGTAFESSAKLNCIYIKGNEPIPGHLDLTSVDTIGAYVFDGCPSIVSVEFAEYPKTTTLGTELFKGCKSLKNVKLPFNLAHIGSEVFEDCTSLSEIVIYSDATIASDAFKNCKNLKTIKGLRNSHAQAYAEEHGLEFILPNVVSVYLDGELKDEIDVVEGVKLLPRLTDGKACLFYYDEGFAEPYDYSMKIYESLTLYAQPIVYHEGFMVRSEGYNGLRSVYNFDYDAFSGNSIYNVKEMGSISSLERGIKGENDIKLSDNHIFTNVVVRDNALCGKISSIPNGNEAQFAHTATGYDKGGVLNAKNATEVLHFRAYVVIENKETGETFELYTDPVSATLREKAALTVEKGDASLSAAQKEFLSVAANVEYDREMIYTEDELMAYIYEMYDDIDHVIYGQQLGGGSSPDVLANYLAKFRDETGDYPGVIGLDQVSINQGKYTDEQKDIYFDNVLEYVRRGGIITLSIHLTNPRDASAGYRGTLGFEDAWEEILTKGSPLNLSLHTYLEDVRDTLQRLEDRGIPVLFRPLHEMNISSFWWCVNQNVDGNKRVLDSSYVIRLWKYYYEFFEVECDLDNLVWVYGPNYTNNTSTTSGTQHVMYAYPGDEYVEMVGCDWYTSTDDYKEIDGAGKSFSSLMATGYPVAITEFGPSGKLLPETDGDLHPYRAMRQLELVKNIAYKLNYSMVYILNWTSKWSILEMGDSNDFMADSMIYGTNETYYGLIADKVK